jgi:hypothetical protein
VPEVFNGNDCCHFKYPVEQWVAVVVQGINLCKYFLKPVLETLGVKSHSYPPEVLWSFESGRVIKETVV